jgi:nitronate monooxygenase
MWHTNKLTQLLDIELPIIQAPMGGGITTPELVAAVSSAGGLGSLGAGYMNAENIRETAAQIRTKTKSPFGINLFVPEEPMAQPESIEFAHNILQTFRSELGIERFSAPERFAEPFEEQVQAVFEIKPALFSFTFGVPSPSLVQEMKAAGIAVMGTATTVAEAQALAKLNVDLICAQGAEAGAHRATFLGGFEESLVGTIALVPQVVDAVSMPVVAAGGIMDGRGVAAALALGAVGVQLGTAFLLCTESGAHPTYKEALKDARDDNTVLTRAFSGRPARAIANRFIHELAPHADALPPYPVQNALTKDIRAAAAEQSRPDLISLWSGQAALLARAIPAGELIRALVRETEATLNRLA